MDPGMALDMDLEKDLANGQVMNQELTLNRDKTLLTMDQSKEVTLVLERDLNKAHTLDSMNSWPNRTPSLTRETLQEPETMEEALTTPRTNREHREQTLSIDPSSKSDLENSSSRVSESALREKMILSEKTLSVKSQDHQPTHIREKLKEDQTEKERLLLMSVRI